MTIAFLNVGQDTHQAALLCRSARISNPRARLVQVTDGASPEVSGVDEVVRCAESANDLMYFRTLSFSRVPVEGATYFLDTDMLVMKQLPELEGIGFCVREFERSAVFNHAFRGLDLAEHKGKTLGEVYPIIACTTFSSGDSIWPEIHGILEQLPVKYRIWYGDQEALRNYTERNRDYIPLRESEFACLPEFYPKYRDTAKIAHFKGHSRKPLLTKVAQQLGLI